MPAERTVEITVVVEELAMVLGVSYERAWELVTEKEDDKAHRTIKVVRNHHYVRPTAQLVGWVKEVW